MIDYEKEIESVYLAVRNLVWETLPQITSQLESIIQSNDIQEAELERIDADNENERNLKLLAMRGKLLREALRRVEIADTSLAEAKDALSWSPELSPWGGPKDDRNLD